MKSKLIKNLLGAGRNCSSLTSGNGLGFQGFQPRQRPRKIRGADCQPYWLEKHYKKKKEVYCVTLNGLRNYCVCPSLLCNREIIKTLRIVQRKKFEETRLRFLGSKHKQKMERRSE